jgi:hypothetical protein
MFRNILDDVFPVIEKVAPVLATVLGSPVAGVATSLGLNLLADKFGVPHADMQNLQDAIKNDPQSESKLSEIDKSLIKFISNQVDNPKPMTKFSMHLDMEWDADANSLRPA